MFDRIALRTAFWGTLAAISTLMIAVSSGTVQLPSFVAVAPLLSVVALTVAVAGWRLLHRELLHRMQEDATLQERVRRLHDAMHASRDGMFLLRSVRDQQGELIDFEITEANSTGAAMLYCDAEALTGTRLRRDLDTMGETLFAQYADVVTFVAPLHEEARVHRRLVAASWVLHQVTPTTDGVAVTVRDISTQKRESVRLRKASLTDDLTRLYNRRGFMALADQQLRVARRQGKDAVVLYADMNGFKGLNDTYGHAVGDKALVAVSRLLQDTVRDCDVVARLGGDEFCILALDADGVGARIIQKRIEERIAMLNASGALPASVGLTIGHTRVRPSDPAGITELLARADQLLYARKRRRALTPTAVPAMASSALSTPSVAPRQSRRTARSGAAVITPSMPIPPEVAAVAMATARNMPGLMTAGMPPAMSTERGVTSPA